ncbi:TRAP transporter small permease [Ureibacillus chungkukjangi]|uniref:TRAP-type C4-dicarboxylate transport system permease small subunit n=1 Tax=Ureibacillus chungkukjangi TaxID=1202712 RepID=A0A318TK89_9BACL|nr:TRAP transporter small permease [Ureibacillus chungkukjangi]MCM3389370.1 TRAP transporter small permease [Ureibacillus chungkukjangi]PYF05136.1 TRAP-type C4-dicarboxylate transport system permease small subunit [Ureibacillus chungkukjangi]
MWHKFEKGLYKTQEFLIAIALIVIMIAVILQIVGRLLGWHSLGMPEYAAIGMTTITFLGASAITYTREYISIELSQMIKIKNIQTIMNLIVDIILIIFVVVFFNIVYSFLKFVGESGEKTLEAGIPLSIIYGIIVLSIVVMGLHCVSNIFKGIQKLRKGGDI